MRYLIWLREEQWSLRCMVPYFGMIIADNKKTQPINFVKNRNPMVTR